MSCSQSSGYEEAAKDIIELFQSEIKLTLNNRTNITIQSLGAEKVEVEVAVDSTNCLTIIHIHAAERH